MSVPEDFFDNGAFIPARLSEHIVSNLMGCHLVTPTTERGGDTVWYYHEELGIFKPDGISFIREEAEKALGPRTKTAHVNETVFITQIKTYKSPKDFTEKPGLIILKNGVYHLDTGELTEHSPTHYAKSALPVTYDPDAKCPEILKFLSQVIPDAVPTFQEWIGYHLYKDMIYHKAAMYIGDGQNGKTTLQDVMNAFLGHDNVSQVSLYNLISNRFATSELYLKLANISPEISNDDLKRTGTFKALTGHDRIRAEKKYQAAFNFTNYAKLTFLCNLMPSTPDKTRAFFRRWLIFVFPNTFEGDKCDSKILEKLTTQEELSGLLNWALEGLRRLRDVDHFSKSLSSDELQAVYESMSDPITAFIETCLTHSTSGAELKDDVYRAYYSFCRQKGYVAVSSRTFTSELKPRITDLGESTRTIDGRRGRCWVGIRLSGDTQNTLDTDFILEVATSSIEVRDRSVPSVTTVTVEADDGLVKEAVSILEEAGGSMDQVNLWRILMGLGYNQGQASKILRVQKRFRFQGAFVKLIVSKEELS